MHNRKSLDSNRSQYIRNSLRMQASKYAAPDGQQDSISAAKQAKQDVMETKEAKPSIMSSKYASELPEEPAEPSMIDSSPPVRSSSLKAKRQLDVSAIADSPTSVYSPREMSTDEPQNTSPAESKALPPVPIQEQRGDPLSTALDDIQDHELAPSVLESSKLDAPDKLFDPVKIAASLQADEPSPDLPLQSGVGTSSSNLRTAKKSKKGKNCIIRLPAHASRTYQGASMPWSLEDIKARLEEFEKQGYDTKGYGQGQTDGHNHFEEEAASRTEMSIVPNSPQKGSARRFEVSIPDRRAWEAYMNQLTEERLRALGVSSPDDQLPSPMQRQESSGLSVAAKSPPLPTSSSNSQHLWQQNTFSAPFSPAVSTNNTSLTGMISPVPSLSHQMLPNALASRSPLNFSPANRQPMGYPGQSRPMQQHAAIMNVQDKVPPSIPGFPLQFHGHARQSPDVFADHQQTPRAVVSPVNAVDPREMFADRLRAASEQRMRLAEQKFNDNRRANTPTLTTPKNEQSIEEAQFASPRPQGHRHNISQNLEREAENAEYYPGEYVNQDDGQEGDSVLTRNLLNNGQPTWQKSAIRPSHVPKPSMSGLNADAKPFNPSKGHGRTISSLGTTAGQQPLSPNARQIDPLRPSISLATAHADGSVSGSTLNVEAPEFKPPSQKKFSFSSLGFNFSMNRSPTTQTTPEDGSEALDKNDQAGSSSKIFGRLADIVMPAKKSKAIPIVQPDPVSENDDDDIEDEDGRAAQSEARRKRNRRGGDDGDQVPRFAVATPEPLLEHQNSIDRSQNVNDAEEDRSEIPWHEFGNDEQKLPEHSTTTPNGRGDEGEENVEESRDNNHGGSPETTNETALSLPLQKNNERSPISSTFPAIDAVMEQLNGGNSDFGIELSDDQTWNVPKPVQLHQSPPGEARISSGQRDILSSETEVMQQDGLMRTDTPGVTGIAKEWLQDQSGVRSEPSPVRRLNKLTAESVSDWNDMISSGEEFKIPARSPVVDSHLSVVLEAVLKRHLEPFEKSLSEVRATVATLSGTNGTIKRSISAHEQSDSDADDEEESFSQPRPRSAKSDKRVATIKAAVQEALSASQNAGLDQIEQEVKLRKAAENRADDIQRMITISEREIALYKESVENNEEKIRELEEERKRATSRHKQVEEELRTKTLDFTAEVAALESTLDEYRASSNKWREEIEEHRKVRREQLDTIETLKQEAAGHVRAKEEISDKVNNLREELATATTNHANNRSAWQAKDEELAKKFEIITVRLDEELRVRDNLEGEILRLTERDKEAVRQQVALEELQNAKRGLDATLSAMERESLDNQQVIARLEREAHDARENTAAEVQRTKTKLEAAVEVANQRTAQTRAELESRLRLVKDELEHTKQDASSTKNAHSAILKDMEQSHKAALREANEASSAALREAKSQFEKSGRELTEQHRNSIRAAAEDKKRAEAHIQSLLDVSKAQNDHLLEKISHLEEKLTIAQSAAQAAAAAAQSARASSPYPTAQAHQPAASAPQGYEKVSPQALRESILVLQEQLHDREIRIEQLEQEAAQVDHSLPDKLHARETEAGWLRELLGLRLDDLSELVKTLDSEDFDRMVVRNVAIRIRASLQMEQHAKERTISGETSSVTASIAALTNGGAAVVLPTLSDIQNFASPRAAQLAAAWGNWRKGRESPSVSSLREAVNADTPSRRPLAESKRHKSSGSRSSVDNMTAENFMTGLMTPPASNLRKTPTPSSTTRPLAGIRPRTPSDSTHRGSVDDDSMIAPETPPLLRTSAYDFDAEIGPEGPSEYEYPREIGEEDAPQMAEVLPYGEVEGHE